MSRYGVNKVLWQVSRDDIAGARYIASPGEFLRDRELTAEEHGWLLDRNYASMFAAGANPFLLYTFRIVVSGGWSWQLMGDHAKALAHLAPPLDITT